MKKLIIILAACLIGGGVAYCAMKNFTETVTPKTNATATATKYVNGASGIIRRIVITPTTGQTQDVVVVDLDGTVLFTQSLVVASSTSNTTLYAVKPTIKTSNASTVTNSCIVSLTVDQ